MPQVRHAALCVSDIERSARFYARAFDMVEVERGSTPRADYCYLVDGECHLALLHYRSDDMAGIKNSGNFIGAHHFGIQVEDLRAAQAKTEAAGGKFHFNLGDEKKGNFESKYRDPNGAIFDISYGGWGGTPTQRVGDRPENMPPRGRKGVGTLRHVAVAVKDPEKSAAFFCHVFGFHRVGIPMSAGGRIDLSDGYFNIALIRAPGEEAVLGHDRGADFIGTHHVGFSVPDLRALAERIGEVGGRSLPASAKSAPFGERRYADPDGTVFVVSEKGWVSASERSAMA